MADSISAIPQQPFLGRLAEFLRFLEKDRPEFLPPQLGVMQGISKLALPQASTIENLSYGNQPFTMPPSGTGAMIPQAKTGRKPEIADLVSMISGVPGAGAVADVGTKLSNQAADALVRAITRNPQATAPGVLQETAMPFMQAVAPKMPGLLQAPAKSDLGFYSALEQATMPLQNKGTGSQFLAQIEKTAGVKPEEVKWTGLDEFLKSRQNVTKQEVQDYLAANRVNIQEIRLGDVLNDPTGRYPYRSADEWSAAVDRAGRARNWDEVDRLHQAWEAAEGFGPAGSTKFSKYTLPGGENYREILLTLPRKTVEAQPMDISGFSVRTTENAMFPYTGQRDIEVLDSAGNVVSRRSGFRGTDQEAIQNYAGTVTTQAQKADESLLNYRSSHFEQPNILAHMRVNDRVVDGKKTLFIEEIQSDWHQAGRKKGYATGEKAELPEGTKVFEPGAADSPGQTNQAFTVQIPRSVNGRSLFYGTTREEALANAQSFIAQPSLGAVPDAPFKTTWHELTLKRAIQEASEKGYDQIAFTTGKTQAERYDLSKQLSRVGYRDGRLQGYDKDGALVMNKAVNPDELPDYVGKELGAKMAENAKKDAETRILLRQAIKNNLPEETVDNLRSQLSSIPSEYSGLDLQVGGEGMKGFYDQILPKSLEKLGKKFDAKVGKTEMDGVEVWQMDITPKMRESVLTKGQPLFAATPAVGLLGRDEEQ